MASSLECATNVLIDRPAREALHAKPSGSIPDRSTNGAMPWRQFPFRGNQSQWLCYSGGRSSFSPRVRASKCVLGGICPASSDGSSNCFVNSRSPVRIRRGALCKDSRLLAQSRPIEAELVAAEIAERRPRERVSSRSACEGAATDRHRRPQGRR